jgi:hypothetical protein
LPTKGYNVVGTAAFLPGISDPLLQGRRLHGPAAAFDVHESLALPAARPLSSLIFFERPYTSPAGPRHALLAHLALLQLEIPGDEARPEGQNPRSLLLDSMLLTLQAAIVLLSLVEAPVLPPLLHRDLPDGRNDSRRRGWLLPSRAVPVAWSSKKIYGELLHTSDAMTCTVCLDLG